MPLTWSLFKPLHLTTLVHGVMSKNREFAKIGSGSNLYNSFSSNIRSYTLYTQCKINEKTMIKMVKCNKDKMSLCSKFS